MKTESLLCAFINQTKRITHPAPPIIALALLSAIGFPSWTLRAQEATVFTYQGRLGADGALANGSYDFRFSIFDSTNSPGVLIGGPLTNFAVAVSNGLFTTPLDFGVAPFDGSDRWLDISVRTNGTGSFTTLAARQQITLAPYAIMSRSSLFAVSNFTVGAALVLPPTNVTFYSGGGSVFRSDSDQENVFVGSGAGNWPATTGQANTAVGNNALENDTAAGDNSAFGDGALSANTSGRVNTAIGSAAMSGNTNGSFNSALGAFALGGFSSGVSGSYNTAEGYGAMSVLTSGINNTANGCLALLENTSGGGNVAVGYQALYDNTSGFNNTAVGESALLSYTGIGYNTALGDGALQLLTSGNDNIGIGDFGGHDITAGSWNIHIGNAGTSGDDHTIKIGEQGTQNKTYVAGIYGTSVSGSAQVYVSSSGQLSAATPAFIHTATTANTVHVNGIGDETEIDNSLCNGKPGAMLIITLNFGASSYIPDGHPFFVAYNSTDNKWLIVSNGGSINAFSGTGQQFNVLVANP